MAHPGGLLQGDASMFDSAMVAPESMPPPRRRPAGNTPLSRSLPRRIPHRWSGSRKGASPVVQEPLGRLPPLECPEGETVGFKWSSWVRSMGMRRFSGQAPGRGTKGPPDRHQGPVRKEDAAEPSPRDLLFLYGAGSRVSSRLAIRDRRTGSRSTMKSSQQEMAPGTPGGGGPSPASGAGERTASPTSVASGCRDTSPLPRPRQQPVTHGKSSNIQAAMPGAPGRPQGGVVPPPTQNHSAPPGQIPSLKTAHGGG